MNVTVNGRDRDLPSGSTVADAVTAVTDRTSGVAVAVNDDVVARGAWPTTTLSHGDRVEILVAVQGG